MWECARGGTSLRTERAPAKHGDDARSSSDPAADPLATATPGNMLCANVFSVQPKHPVAKCCSAATVTCQASDEADVLRMGAEKTPERNKHLRLVGLASEVTEPVSVPSGKA